MGRYMDNGVAIGQEIVADNVNITGAVEEFVQTQRNMPDTFDRGPEPLMCYSLIDEDALKSQGNAAPAAVMAWRRWSKVCGRYILFIEAMDQVPSSVTKPESEGGYGLKMGIDLVQLTPRKHSTPLKSWEKYGCAFYCLRAVRVSVTMTF